MGERGEQEAPEQGAQASALNWKQVLAQSNGVLQAVFESLPNYLAVLDGRGRVLQTNALWNTYALSKGLAYRNGFANAPYADLLDAVTGGVQETKRAVLAGIADVMSAKAPGYQLDYSFQSCIEKRWFVMNVMPVRDGVASVVVSHQDVTRFRTEFVQHASHAPRMARHS